MEDKHLQNKTAEERFFVFINYYNLLNVPVKDVGIFARVYKIASLIGKYAKTHRKNRPQYRCHSVCRAIVRHVSGLNVVDGYYFGIIQVSRKNKLPDLKENYYPHTWLLCDSKKTIIDPYPVGVLCQPLLVPIKGKWTSFGAGLYIVNKNLTPKFTKPKILQETEILTEHIGKLLARAKK